MNIKLPLIGGLWDILLLGGLMLTVVLFVIFIFRRRRML